MEYSDFTILIVEDNTILLKTYEMLFKKKGYNVLIADTGENAIELTFSLKPDLILLDINLGLII